MDTDTLYGNCFNLLMGHTAYHRGIPSKSLCLRCVSGTDYQPRTAVVKWFDNTLLIYIFQTVGVEMPRVLRHVKAEL
jgi:hypothetical protein